MGSKLGFPCFGTFPNFRSGLIKCSVLKFKRDVKMNFVTSYAPSMSTYWFLAGKKGI